MGHEERRAGGANRERQFLGIVARGQHRHPLSVQDGWRVPPTPQRLRDTRRAGASEDADQPQWQTGEDVRGEGGRGGTARFRCKTQAGKRRSLDFRCLPEQLREQRLAGPGVAWRPELVRQKHRHDRAARRAATEAAGVAPSRDRAPAQAGRVAPNRPRVARAVRRKSVPPAGRRKGDQPAAGVRRYGDGRRRLVRGRHAVGRAGGAHFAALPVPLGAGHAPGERRIDPATERLGAGVAAVVFFVEQHAGRRVVPLGQARRVVEAECADGADSPHGGRPALASAGRKFRRPMAADS